MNYKIVTLIPFEKELKRLAKKYPSLKDEYQNFLQALKNRPDLGIPLGNNCYKIRIAIASKGKGKSGGGRVITYFQVVQTSVYLLTIFDKSEKENITNKEINQILALLKR